MVDTGDAGGYIAANASSIGDSTKYYADGATQNGPGERGSTFGTFGQGASVPMGTELAGGGGGYYGGNSHFFTASGGSGYIGNTNLTNKVMYCYNCTESSEEATKTISTSNVSENAISTYAKIGSGYAKITFISES